MDKSVYICATPYQVMGAVLLQSERKESAKIVIVDKFSGSSVLAEKLKKEGLFKDIILLDETKIWKSRSRNIVIKRLSTIRTYIKCKSIAEKVLSDINEIDHLFVSSRGAIARLFCMYVAEYAKDTKIHYFDDGMGSYTNSEVDIKKADYILRRVLVGKRASSFTFDRYLYSPEFYKELNGEAQCTANSMPKLKDYMPVLNRLFTKDKLVSINNKVIVFDGLIEDDLTQRGQETYINIINKIILDFDVIVKPHPRSTKRHFETEYYKDISTPFEIICGNQEMSNKIMVTNISTAVFTPKILFDQEPYVILLLDILKDERVKKSSMDYSLSVALKNAYRDSKKVVIPKTMEELRVIMQTLRES